MTLILNSDIKFVHENRDVLKEFIESKFEYEDINQMLNVFLTPIYAPFVKKIIEDLSRSHTEKMELIMYKFFNGFSLHTILAEMGQGKGTTSASIIMYAKENGYFKKFNRKRVVGLLPCPELPFIDDYVWDISQIQVGDVVYCPEMALVFGNTSQDYSKNETSQVPKELLKLRQKGVAFIGESQNDSLVNITFFKFLKSYIYRYISPKVAKFQREQNIIKNPLIPYIMPPSALDDRNECIIENLTKILYDDDNGFISVEIPRTPKYTKEMSESFKDTWTMVEPHLVKAIKEDGEDFVKMKDKLEARGVERTPKQWEEFLQKHNITRKLTTTEQKNL